MSHKQSNNKPTWREVLQWVSIALFVLFWFSLLHLFYAYHIAYEHGSPTPTATHTERWTLGHGRIPDVYITPAEKRQPDLLKLYILIGFPIVFGLHAYFVIVSKPEFLEFFQIKK